MKTNLSFTKAATASLLAAALFFSAGCSRGDRSAGQTIDDTAISAKVKTAFAQDPGVRAVDVKVESYKGTVQLSGWADSPEQKARAEEIAKTIPGVKSVENKIGLKTDVSKPKTP